jgi:hypothetical protein
MLLRFIRNVLGGHLKIRCALGGLQVGTYERPLYQIRIPAECTVPNASI